MFFKWFAQFCRQWFELNVLLCLCVQERVRLSKLVQDKMRQHRLDQQDDPQYPDDRQRTIIQRTRNIMTDSSTEDSGNLQGQFRD